MAGVEAVLFLLEQDRIRPADTALQIGLMHPVGHLSGPRRPFLLHRRRQLGHGRRLGAGADGVGEDVHGGKAALFDERQRLGEFLLRLAGEAGDEIGGDGGAVEIFVQQPYRFIEPGGVVSAVHALQGGVAAGLQRQVEVGAEVGELRRTAAEVLGDGAGLETAQAQAHVACRGADGF